MNLRPGQRRIARDLCRAGAVASAVMLVLGAAAAFGGPDQAVFAAVNAGPALIVGAPGTTSGVPLTSGGSATPFAVQLPAGAECTGDSASGGYRIQSYVVPADVDPNTLTYAAQGPVPGGTGAAFRQPLFTTSTTRFVNITTGVATTAGGGGQIPSTPAFSFGFLGAGGATTLPPGTYNVGLACTLGPASATQLDKYWNVQLTFAADAADLPSGITWTVADPPADTTTTTTTTIAETTTTTTTTTTAPPPAATTPTTVAPPGATTTSSTTSTTLATAAVPISGSTTGGGTSGGSSTGGSPSSSMSGTLPRTGSSPMAIFVWGVLFLVLGRMAILLGRKPEVRQVAP